MLELVLAQLQALVDVEHSLSADGSVVRVTVLDFEGFDEDFCEVERDYDVDAVDALEAWLEEHCVSFSGDFYQYYEFDGFVVQVGYESYEI